MGLMSGKTFNAADMLRIGPGRPGTERPVAQTTSELVPETPGQPEAPSSVAPTPARLTYQRTTVYYTPRQREWLDERLGEWPRNSGLSMSDISRLALARLMYDVDMGNVPDLRAALTSQAEEEERVLPGRKNRGLPAN